MTGVIATIPKFQFFEGGQPMVGGTLTAYIAGTTTPTATWQDSNLSTANTNPITLDSRGECVLWLDSSVFYKFVLKNAAGVVQWTQDNIANADTLFRSDLAAASGASLIGYDGSTVQTVLDNAVSLSNYAALRTYTGRATGIRITSPGIAGFFQRTGSAADNGGTVIVDGSGRSWQRLFDSFFSIRWFGAKGDGLTNDTSAIQAAINAAQALNTQHPFFVEIPEGNYLYTSLLVSQSRVCIRGQGRLIKTTTTGNGIVFKGASTIFNVGIIGVTMGAASSCTSGSLVYFEGVIQGEVNVTVKPFPAAAWDGVTLYKCIAITLLPNTQIENCTNDGFVAKDCIDITINGGRSDANGRNGYLFDTVSGVYANNVTAFGSANNGYKIETSITPIIADKNGFYFFTSCIADKNGAHNWFIKQVFDSVFTSCWGSSQKTTLPDMYGFLIDGCGDLELNGCTALNNNAGGARVIGGSNVISFIGGKYNNNGVIADSIVQAGISLANASKILVTGVVARNHPPVTTQKFGIECDNSILELSLVGCNFRGNSQSSANFQAIPANFCESVNLTDTPFSFASATSIEVGPFADVVQITGAEIIYDITPKWAGRKLICVTTGGAKFVNQNLGSAFVLPTPELVPGPKGTASFVCSGSQWVLQSSSINDGI